LGHKVLLSLLLLLLLEEEQQLHNCTGSGGEEEPVWLADPSPEGFAAWRRERETGSVVTSCSFASSKH